MKFFEYTKGLGVIFVAFFFVASAYLVVSCESETPQQKIASQYQKDSVECADREYVMKKIEELKFKPKFVFRIDRFKTIILTQDTQAIYIDNGASSFGTVTSNIDIYPLWERSERNLKNQKPRIDTVIPTNVNPK